MTTCFTSSSDAITSVQATITSHWTMPMVSELLSLFYSYPLYSFHTITRQMVQKQINHVTFPRIPQSLPPSLRLQDLAPLLSFLRGQSSFSSSSGFFDLLKTLSTHLKAFTPLSFARLIQVLIKQQHNKSPSQRNTSERVKDPYYHSLPTWLSFFTAFITI